jgi:hypothetical protein
MILTRRADFASVQLTLRISTDPAEQLKALTETVGLASALGQYDFPLRCQMMSTVNAPSEFRELVQAFSSGSLDWVKSKHEPNLDPDGLEVINAWIAHVVKRLSHEKKQIVKQFLTDLLRENPKEEELQALWNSSNYDYYFVGKDGHEAMRWLLTTIRDQIE